ncbi:serine protease [Terasakiella sp. SH-1]|uniref:S1 family peptidase n=1 Tax=Terasakiella sp. SH-1 TaxID=2560057 RepID=UPI0010736304|nr:serine protease [Terasakiella sp. SH-1]
MKLSEKLEHSSLIGTKGFCSSPWRGLAFGFASMVILTFVWGFVILNGYKHDDHFEKYQHLSVPEFLFRDAGGPSPQELANSLAPGIVGISAAGANMPLVSSGALVSPKGHVLTALHPIKGLTDIDVHVRTLQGIKRYEAQVAKSHDAHNLVVLKILTPERFQYFTLADTAGLGVNSAVIAMGQTNSGSILINNGSIQSLNNTINAGGVAMKSLAATNAIFSWQQTGGPLINNRGEIVGVNMAFSGANNTVEGFIVPAHVVVSHFQDVVGFKVAKPKVQAPAAPQVRQMTPAAAPVAWGPSMGATAQPMAMQQQMQQMPVQQMQQMRQPVQQQQSWWQKAQNTMGLGGQ